MPIFSLPSPYGIGTLGKEARGFVDFLKEAGQSYWQILPLGHTGFGDSPYQSFSSFAGNPYFIDLDTLCDLGLLKKSELEPHIASGDIDYAWLYETRYPLFRRAFSRFDCEDAEFREFCRKNEEWLEDYALFMAIKDSESGRCFLDWEPSLRRREKAALEKVKKELKGDILFYKTLQFWFFSQWKDLKTYANRKGIKIIGDLPIYVSADSADVWANPEEFQVGKEGKPKRVAGTPPDAFSETGQLWGNPLYDWDKMKENGYTWWKKRLTASAELFDSVRIDHFRAFDEYYSIPADSDTAAKGKWCKGPGIEFFDALKKETENIDIIAEDLGLLTDSVLKLLEDCGFPGMAVLQFAFSPDSDSRYLPHNIGNNTVVYTGTHDNNTILGWFEQGDREEIEYCKQYLRLNDSEGYNWGMIKAALSTPADTCILCMQDFIGLSSSARINTPSTNEGNWCWRIDGGCLNSWLAGIIYEITNIYRRLPPITVEPEPQANITAQQ